jgi:hypothetical protein
MEGFANPFRPGAGHPPPYLAGRAQERNEFERLLKQEVVLENMVLTGLRGVGKTVLLDTFRPIAQQSGWLWVGADLSESASIGEDAIATRLITDLATVTSGLLLLSQKKPMGFNAAPTTQKVQLDYATLASVYQRTPGLVADKLKAVFNLAWSMLGKVGSVRGVIFAYDEAQNLADHAKRNQFPLSLLLDLFQSIQKQGVRFMLVLTGLPTLFPKLVDARTFAERMFRVVFLRKLHKSDSRDAIVKPMSKAPVQLDDAAVDIIVEQSGGYPYFIQFVCREVFDIVVANVRATGETGSVPIEPITRKLDNDFFAGRWARVTDRQRELMWVIAHLESADDEFTVQEVAEQSKKLLDKPFSSSHINQILSTLGGAGLVYKNRHGRYSFAVPLFGQFVLRTMSDNP